MRKIKNVILFLTLTAIMSCADQPIKTIAFSGMISVNSDNTVTLSAQNGGKGIFKKSDIVNEISTDLTNAENYLQVKVGAEVEIDGKKLIVGKDLLDPNSEEAKALACKCRQSCGAGQCCAVSGYKTKCLNGVCQYTMETCTE